MYFLVVCFSLMGFCIAGLFGKYIGPKGCSLITIASITGSLNVSLFVFYEVGLMQSPVYLKLGEWLNSEALHIHWGFMFDSLTVIMCIVVTFISLLVHLYSVEYMAHDPHFSRFMSYLSLFTFFMLILITADNLIQMFLGWEGVGLCSYLLINFWFTRIQANKSAIKAMILNRVGDFFLIIAILMIFYHFKAVDYSTIATLTPFFKTKTMKFLNQEFELIPLICVFIFLGAVGKSSQVGLHTWLPDAMEGPTPVSALIHAATMVTAGVFLITRTSFLYEYAPHVLEFIALLGAITSFFASSVGLLQNDLKKVIAYSTCSQLGYMIFACGLSNYFAGFFHLVNHAFFKALLFLAAGAIIHSVSDEQDIRRMGGLKSLIPFTYSIVVIGSLALTGFPFLAGFYSKDLILELSYGKFTSVSMFSYVLGSLGAFFTSFYSTRLLCLTFLTLPNGYKRVVGFANETFNQIFLALFFLSGPSIFIGFVAKDLMAGPGSNFLDQALYTNPVSLYIFDGEFISHFFKILPVFLSLSGITLSFTLYNFQPYLLFSYKMSAIGQKVYNFLNRKWFFDRIYNELFSQSIFSFGYSISYKLVDQAIFEMVGPSGLAGFLSKISSQLIRTNSGFLYHYMLLILIGLVIIFCLRELFVIHLYQLDQRLFVLITFAYFFWYEQKVTNKI